MELSKQEIELFLLLSELQSKNVFYEMFITFTNKFTTGFEKRKWNYLNRKWNYISYFQNLNKKTSFRKCFKLLLMSLKPVSKTGKDQNIFFARSNKFLPSPFLKRENNSPPATKKKLWPTNFFPD